MENRDSVVLETVISVIERQLNVYVKIFCMLYADDTALMTESPYTFTTWYFFYEYCQYRKLSVNIEKNPESIGAFKERPPHNLLFSYKERK